MLQAIKNLSVFKRVVLLALIVLFPFFFIGGPQVSSNAFFRAFWDCGHFVFFIGLVIAVNIVYPLQSPRRWLLISSAVFVGGGLIEIIQAHIGRDGNWDDLLRDLTGTWLGLFFLQAPSLLVWLCRGISVALLLPSLWAVVIGARIEIQSYSDFPLIDGFESAIEVKRWKGNVEISSAFASQGSQSLLLHLSPKPYSGAYLRNYLGDWRGYKTVAVDIYNPNESLQITFRINDLQHQQGDNDFRDRFNQRITLNRGWNNIRIDLAQVEHAPQLRKMDMDKIIGVEFFVGYLTEPKDIYLDNLRLE